MKTKGIPSCTGTPGQPQIMHAQEYFWVGWVTSRVFIINTLSLIGVMNEKFISFPENKRLSFFLATEMKVVQFANAKIWLVSQSAVPLSLR